ncbi:hypothetical protein HK102_007836, partial [Quaeritorhiza haematococci]
MSFWKKKAASTDDHTSSGREGASSPVPISRSHTTTGATRPMSPVSPGIYGSPPASAPPTSSQPDAAYLGIPARTASVRSNSPNGRSSQRPMSPLSTNRPMSPYGERTSSAARLLNGSSPLSPPASERGGDSPPSKTISGEFFEQMLQMADSIIKEGARASVGGEAVAPSSGPTAKATSQSEARLSTNIMVAPPAARFIHQAPSASSTPSLTSASSSWSSSSSSLLSSSSSSSSLPTPESWDFDHIIAGDNTGASKGRAVSPSPSSTEKRATTRATTVTGANRRPTTTASKSSDPHAGHGHGNIPHGHRGGHGSHSASHAQTHEGWAKPRPAPKPARVPKIIDDKERQKAEEEKAAARLQRIREKSQSRIDTGLSSLRARNKSSTRTATSNTTSSASSSDAHLKLPTRAATTTAVSASASDKFSHSNAASRSKSTGRTLDTGRSKSTTRTTPPTSESNSSVRNKSTARAAGPTLSSRSKSTTRGTMGGKTDPSSTGTLRSKSQSARTAVASISGRNYSPARNYSPSRFSERSLSPATLAVRGTATSLLQSTLSKSARGSSATRPFSPTSELLDRAASPSSSRPGSPSTPSNGPKSKIPILVNRESAHFIAQSFLSGELLNVFVFTSRGPLIIPCPPTANVDWLLQTASQESMDEEGNENGDGAPFTVARTNEGKVLGGQEKIREIHKKHALLVALTAEETQNIPDQLKAIFGMSVFGEKEDEKKNEDKDKSATTEKTDDTPKTESDDKSAAASTTEDATTKRASVSSTTSSKRDSKGSDKGNHRSIMALDSLVLALEEFDQEVANGPKSPLVPTRAAAKDGEEAKKDEEKKEEEEKVVEQKAVDGVVEEKKEDGAKEEEAKKDDEAPATPAIVVQDADEAAVKEAEAKEKESVVEEAAPK